MFYKREMDDETTPLPLEQQVKALRIIWTALLLGPVLMMGVFHFVRTQPGAPALEAGLLVPFLGVSCILSVMGPLAGRFVEAAQLRAAREQRPPPRPQALLTTLTVLRCALGEGPALFAAITYFLTGSPWAFVPFGLALAAIVWVRPSNERVDAVLRELGEGL